MAGAAQGDCAERDPRGGRLRSRHNLRIGLWGALQSVSPSLGVELRPVDVPDAGEIERALAAFARPKNGGLIATGSAATIVRRDRVISLAARHQLPAVYYDRYFRRAAVDSLKVLDLNRPIREAEVTWTSPNRRC